MPVRIPSARAVARAASPPALSSGPNPLELLEAFRRRWPFALGLGLLAGVAAAVIGWFVIPLEKYNARAMLFVSAAPPRFVFSTSDNSAQHSNEFETFKRTQAAWIKSRGVLNAALSQPDVAKLAIVRKQRDPVLWLEEQIEVNFAEGSEILNIAINGKDPLETKLLVNAVADAYLKEVVGKQKTIRSAKLLTLKGIYDDYQEKLADKRKALKGLAETAGSDNEKVLVLKNQFALERLDAAQKELTTLQSDLRRAKVDLSLQKSAQGGAPEEIPASLIDDAVKNDPTVAQYQARIAHFQEALREAQRLVRNPSDPSVQKHQKNLASVQAVLADHVEKLRQTVQQQLQGREQAGHDETTAKLEQKVVTLGEVERVLQSEVDRLTKETRTASKTTLDLQSQLHEFAPQDNAANKIGEELEALTVEGQAPDRVSIAERAEAPRLKDEYRQHKLSGGAGVATLLGVVLGISFLELRARRVCSVDQIVNGLGINLVGALPALSLQSRFRGRASQDARSLAMKNLLVESVDAARTVLLHASRAESIRVVMITSAQGGEGKTSLACHLALSLARSGRKTLLIDCDMRNPSAHALFDLPSGPGFSELLRSEVSVVEATHPTPNEGLDVMPAGECDDQAIQLLAQDDVRALFEQLAANYDFVVIDTAPVLPVVDSLLLSQHVDAVLFSVLRGVSRIPKVHEASKRLSNLGSRILGAVVMGVQGELEGADRTYYSRHDSRRTGSF